MTYQLSAHAEDDVRQLLAHIRDVQGSAQNAELVAERLFDAIQELAKMPFLGHRNEFIEDPLAKVTVVSRISIIFDPTTKPLLVLRTVPPGRDLKTLTVRS